MPLAVVTMRLNLLTTIRKGPSQHIKMRLRFVLAVNKPNPPSPLLPLSPTIISPRYPRDNILHAPRLGLPELDTLELEPPPIIHYLEDSFDAGDVYVRLLIREAVSLDPLMIIAPSPSARPLSTSQPPRKWRKKGRRNGLFQDIRGWKRLLNAETSLQHTTF
jgi:hypothetical protein